jgi:phosphoserine phosphatase
VIGLHPFGQAKAVITRQMAEKYEIDLRKSYGYANSFSDVPFLDTVGHAIAVNPDNRLARHAEQHGWEITNFAR